MDQETGNSGSLEETITEDNKKFIDNAVLHAIPYSLLGDIVCTCQHGIHHMARTAAYALLLYSEIERELVFSRRIPTWQLIVAAVCHDLGRMDEGGDPAHGIRGAMRAALAMKDMVGGILITDDHFIEGEIIHAIIHHCDPSKGDDVLSRVLKDADKLDLLRGGQDRLNTDKLFYVHSTNLVERAKQWSLKEWEWEAPPDGLCKP